MLNPIIKGQFGRVKVAIKSTNFHVTRCNNRRETMGGEQKRKERQEITSKRLFPRF